jgi:peptide/nickel transport system permease protein
VVRLVRSVVLTIREEPFIEAAISVGTSTPKILLRHILPGTIAPLLVLGTYICATAILFESGLSFLGTGLPPEIPSWGNMVSEGRTFFQVFPRLVFIPSLFLALTVLGVNLLGDGLRDTLDPRLAKRM